MNDKKKNIVIIDDNGDVFGRMTRAFAGDNDISLVSATSACEDYDSKLRVDDYLIIINETNIETDLRRLVDYLKNRFLYCITPIVVATDQQQDQLAEKNMLEAPFVSYIQKIYDNEILRRLVRNLVDTFHSQRNLNPLTGLPAGKIIFGQVAENIAGNEPFTLMYVDLDNFKEYNEYYGFHNGDRVLVFLSEILTHVIKDMGNDNDFIGHVGGDDFVLFVHDKQRIKAMGERIIKTFDENIVTFYDAADLSKGFIEVRNRAGEMERISIMSISIIMLDDEVVRTTPNDEIYIKMMAEKKKAKKLKGSVLI
ncbi:MAG: diguanylate cyclase [Muribaculaceae bacterium]|nr:diguanylate cyclase [Muribaculaceae bacterium]